MESPLAPLRFVAALARIDELGGSMSTDQQSAELPMWALGDYHAFAKETVWGLGPELVAACEISAGDRVLDVAAGTGNVAIRAAEAGATVVASDLTTANFAAGRREARERGVELEWVEADAQSLPFGDGEFDVVTSCLGAIFAPEHQAVADELVRVCRPGGTIGMINFTPEGLAGRFFGTFERHAPSPPGSLPPTMWGSEDHVRELFGGRVATLDLMRREYVETATSPRDYLDLFTRTFGPTIALRAMLGDEPARLAAFDEEFLQFATSASSGPPDGPAAYRYEYLLVVAETSR